MRKKSIYEFFMKDDTTVYKIFLEKKEKNPKIAYPSVRCSVQKLAEEGGLLEVKTKRKNPHSANWFTITTTGLARLYSFRRKGKRYLNDLKFHQSKHAKEIIDKILKKMYNTSFYDTERGQLFKEALSVSPSLIKSLEKEKITVRIIKDPELFSYILKNYPGDHDFCFDVIPDENQFLYKRFLGEMLPVECVAKDYEKYQDARIKVLLGRYLLFLSEEKGKRKKEQETLSKRMGEIKKSCTDNWVLYIPPVGEPVLACKGCPEYSKK